MGKYLSIFETEDAYNEGKTSLKLPNVSYIASTGNLHYANLIAGATLGDVLMYDINNQKLVVTLGGIWDSTTYPIAQYEPIGICIYPSNQTSDGKGRFMSLKWMSLTVASGSTRSEMMVWGKMGNNLTSKSVTLFNGKENTEKAIALADGSSDNTEAAFPAFAACHKFYTNGTNAGDWYLPSCKELELYSANYDDINAQITKIKNASSSIVDTVNNGMWASTETDGYSYYAYYMNSSGRRIYSGSRSNYYNVRACLSL